MHRFGGGESDDPTAQNLHARPVSISQGELKHSDLKWVDYEGLSSSRQDLKLAERLRDECAKFFVELGGELWTL